MRIALACLMLMACDGARPAAPTCRAITEHGQALVTSLKPPEAESVLAANPRRLTGFPSPEMAAAFERATGACREMNPADAQLCMTHKITDLLTADCEQRAPSAAQRGCWIHATTYAAFVACDVAP